MIHHVLAFLIAAILFWGIDQTLWRIFPNKPATNRWTLPDSLYLGYLRGYPGTKEPAVREFLSRKKLVVLGSSELTGTFPELPQNWIPKYTGLPTLAFGNAGFQSLPILFFLSKFRDLLDSETKLVIILSPHWFRDGDSGLAAFLEYAHKGDFRKINSANREANEIRNFLLRKRRDFSAVPLEIETFISRSTPVVGSLLRALDDLINGDYFTLVQYQSFFYKHLLGFKLGEVTTTPEWFDADFHPPEIDWEMETAAQRRLHQDSSRSNSYGFFDTTWKTLKNFPPQSYKPPKTNNPEFKALEAAVELLHERRVRALFVQSPLNALAYDNLEVYAEQAGRIRDLLDKYEMPYLDFMSLPYEREWLSDYAHFSGLSWLLVDKFIVEELGKR